MKGKQPREREHYVLRTADGALVEVTREVYLEWYQSRRRERYQQERNRKYGLCSLDRLQEKGDYSDILLYTGEGVEETALRNICREKVRETLKTLPTEEARLIELLYFSETKVADVAQMLGCSTKTVQNRRKRILKELYKKMREQGIHGNSF